MSRLIDKYHRPDYDYYEDSLGDRYNDYDELEATPVERLSESMGNDENGSTYDEDSQTVVKKKKYVGGSYRDRSEKIPYPSEIAYSAEDPDSGEGYKYTREDLIALMDRYHNGSDEDKEYVRNQFCKMLTPMIKSMIRTTRGIDSQNMDYIQTCYMYIVKRLDRFDPTISFAFRYFEFVIREGITACHENSVGKTSHSTNIDRKVKKKIRKYESMNLDPSPSRIASETGFSVKQVEDSLSRITAEKLVLGKDLTTIENDDKSNLPLESLLQTEVFETLKNAIDCLPEKEREVILLSYNFYNMPEDFTNKKIAGIMHVTEGKVKELLISAKRHLKRDFSLDQLMGKSKRITQRDHSIYANDPARYSFNPDCDDYQLIDEEETRKPEKTKQELPKEKPQAKEVIVIDATVDIRFETY